MRPSNAARYASLTAEPVVNVLLDLVFGKTVAGLNFALKLLAVAIDLGNVFVSELAPLLLDLAGELLPVTFDAVPIHG